MHQFPAAARVYVRVVVLVGTALLVG